MVFQSGDQVFFKHPKHSWVLGNVSGGSENNWSCKAGDAERNCTGDVIDKLKDADVTNCREDLLDETPDDLLQLTVLHDATLLRCLYIRYFKDIIYTNIGAIVVALNPFNFKIPWYQDDKMGEYLKEGAVIEKNLPHSWAQAHNTYNEMIADTQNQCILISGESGAGKTEATKIVMKYLAQISCQRGSDEEKAAGLAVGAKLNSCSPILESFGNAKTVRNDNSSRFGKFMKVKFTSGGQLVGAHTTKYLLEKSRIVTASENERVYHAFYLVVRGSKAGPFGMEGDSAYKSINAGKCLHNSEFDTAEHFAEVAGAMANIGMTDDEINSIWACTAGIVNLLNVGFAKDGEGSQIDPSAEKYLDQAVKLFQIEKEAFKKELGTTTLVVRGQATVKLLNPVAAVDIRDATAKAMYNGMFGWLVEKSNSLCDVDGNIGNWIGLLDIFGFEDFKFNSFEQLCINLANETLQNHYNTYIFEKDMDECRKEGIDVTEVKCPDNAPCLKLITDPKNGVMAYLDSECALGGSGTDLGFLDKLEADVTRTKNPFFLKKKTSRDTFTIHHYAASVEYNVNGWLEKNRDTLKDDIKLIMRNSSDALVKEFLEAPIPADQKKGRGQTVGGFFKEQVNMLMEVINGTNPHWIRCVKPHPAKKAKMFDGIQTMNQLESSGVLGTVKIRKAGYPVRTLFNKFIVRYRIIIGDKSKTVKSDRDCCDMILKACEMNEKKYAQLGKTKVFMKSEAFPMIERKRNAFLLTHCKTLQKSGRGFLQRLQSNKDMAIHKQKKFAELAVKEYRDYMARSKAIREERARLRREAEIKFRGLKKELEDEADAAIAALDEEYETFMAMCIKETEKRLEAEKERMEMLKQQRESFFRQVYLAKNRMFETEASNASYLSDLYAQEVLLFMERELDFVDEFAMEQRETIAVEEKTERDKFWRSFMQVQHASQVDAVRQEGIDGKRIFYLFEEIQREELFARQRIVKKDWVMLLHFAKQKRSDQERVVELEKKRKAFENHRDREVFKLEQMRREELYRLELSRAAAQRTAGSSPRWDLRNQDSSPTGSLQRSTPAMYGASPQQGSASPQYGGHAPYVDPTAHLLQRAQDIVAGVHSPQRGTAQSTTIHTGMPASPPPLHSSPGAYSPQYAGGSSPGVPSPSATHYVNNTQQSPSSEMPWREASTRSRRW